MVMLFKRSRAKACNMIAELLETRPTYEIESDLTIS